MASNGDDRTRASFIEGLKEGDPKAWEAFQPRYGGMICALFRRFGLRREDWEEVLQDVVVSLFQRIRSFTHNREKPSFRPWLVPFVRCRVIEHWRKNGRTWAPLDEEKMQDLAAGVADECDRLLEEDWRDHVLSEVFRGARARVPPTEWDAFSRLTVEGQSVKEVADALRLSEGTVIVYKSRVLAACRGVAAEMKVEL